MSRRDSTVRGRAVTGAAIPAFRSIQWCLLLAVVMFVGCGSPTAPSGVDGTERDLGSHREVDVTYRSIDGVRLSGTLMLPPTPGRYPAIVFHNGSDRRTRSPYGNVAGFVALGFAVLTYDKRGVGRSGGAGCPYTDPGYFPLLAQDVLAGVRRIAQHPDVRADVIGLFGFSQGGWVVPIAAAEASTEVAFTIIGSGPAVSLGEELLYSRLSGEDRCQASGLPPEEIEAALANAGPSGFEPRPFLERMTGPGLWIYGGRDLSIPVDRSVRRLEGIRTSLGRDFTVVVVPELNHNWIPNGSLCQTQGADWDDGQVIVPWLRGHVPAW
jgi:uncharacterized protein